MNHSFQLVDPLTDRTYSKLYILKLSMQIRARADENTSGKLMLSLVIAERAELAKWLLAALCVDCIVNVINPDIPEDGIHRACEQAGTHWLVTDKDLNGVFSGKVTQINKQGGEQVLTGDDQLDDQLKGSLLIFTSGTTGTPKGVEVTCEQMKYNVGVAVKAFGFDNQWIAASVLPLFHTFTLISDLLTMWTVEGKVVICPNFIMQTVGQVVTAMSRYRVNSYSGVPVIFQVMSRFANAEQMQSIKLAIAGAAPLSEQTREAYKALGHQIIPCYGLSESTCFTCISPITDIRPGSVGKPAGLNLKVVDTNTGDEVPAGERGEIVIKGDSVFRNGYWKQSATADSHYLNGYFKTGDTGYLGDDGFLYITGRQKNMLIKGGEKYYLEDFDRVLSDLDSLDDVACVVTSINDNSDDYICCMVAKPELCKEEIRNKVYACIGQAFDRKVTPANIAFVDAIPRTPTGKALLHDLRKMIEVRAS